MTRRRASVTAALVVAALGVVPLAVGAAAAPSLRDTGVCIPYIWCPDKDKEPEPEPTPTPEPSPTESEAPAEPEEEAPAEPAPAPLDEQAPVYTGTPASMGSKSLSFKGLKGISLVSVRKVDGGSIRVLKISADSITIKGFSLTVRPHDGPGLVTTADTMSLDGNVTVYLGSVSASSLGGKPLTIGTDTPPPLTDMKPGLLDVSMGLVGTLADRITYTNTDQRIVEVE